MKKNEDFEKDNAFLLSKFEDVNGRIEQSKSQNKSLHQQIIGLKHTIENLEKEITALKKNNATLKTENRGLEESLAKERRLLPQNFKIKNKIVKIVSDIEDKDINPQELKRLVDILINEIDYCINQLAK